jgi:glycosyltransferase involved in cell wall biosynthesis
MTKLSIIHLLDYASLDNLGGDCQVAFETAAALVARGHKVTVFAGSEKPEHETLWRGIRIVSFFYDPDESGSMKKFRAVGRDSAKRFGQVFGSEKFDVAAFHQPLISRAFRRGDMPAGAARAYFFHSPWHLEYSAERDKRKGLGFLFNTRVRRRLEKQALKPAQAVITLSWYMKGLAGELHGYPAERIHIITGGVDTERFKPAGDRAAFRRGLSIPEKSPILLCLRRLVPRMGIDSLIRAMRSVLDAHPGAMLLIGGRGPMEAELRSLTAESGVQENVRFLGYVAADDLPLYYAAVDAVIVPTRELEGFGLIVLESLAAGTPVLVTPVGGMTEILDPLKPEWIFKDNSPEAMAAGIRNYLSEKTGTPETRRLCREYALENFTWNHAAERIETLFREIMCQESS